MRRQEKYPNTEIFHYLNTNPKNRITCDCVVRAIAGALVARNNGREGLRDDKLCKFMWKAVMTELSEWACKYGYMPTDTKCYDKYLQYHGFARNGQLRHSDNTKYTLKEFIECHKTGIWLVNMPTHLTLVVDGVNYDIWNCSKSRKKCGVYWGEARA